MSYDINKESKQTGIHQFYLPKVFDGKFAKVLFDKYLCYMLYSSRCELVIMSDKYSTRQVLYLSQDSHQELYAFMQTNLQQQCFKCFIIFYT